MGILHRARRLEATLARTLDLAARRVARSEASEPLEIVHAILDAVDARLEPSGRGGHVFPFNRIRIVIPAASREVRSRYEAVFASIPTIHDRIADRLRASGCDPHDLVVKTTYVAGPAASWPTPHFHLDFGRTNGAATPADAPAASSPQPLKLTVVRGTAEKPCYTFSIPRINLGRCRDVRNSRHRLIRTNDVAFDDGLDAPNHSVSRRHAHIEYVAALGAYRICDDGSAQGTSVVRDGTTIPVPEGSRGVRLRSGDEVVLGHARLRIRIAE
jgi:hypothetical protein